MRRGFLSLVLAALAAAVLSAPAAAQQRIIGGSGAAIESYPYQVKVEVTNNLVLEGSCGGVIRDPNHIITAAHCVTEELLRTPVAPGAVTVRYGTAQANGGQTISVAQVQPHPRYQFDQNYDAALLTLNGSLQGYGGPQVNRIPFAGAGELAAAVQAGQGAVATGFGRTDINSDATSPQLLAVALALRSDDVCSARYGAQYSPPLGVCAGGTGTAAQNNPDTCNGDSGGPLAFNAGGVLKLAGLTSFGDQCGLPNTPGVYTEASNGEICAFLGGGLECLTNPPAPPPRRAARDTVRPTARVTSLRCKRRVCAFRVRTADRGGKVRSLSARVYRRARACRIREGRRRCRTVVRSRKVRAKRIRGGFRGSAKLAAARYRLDAVATDTSGNRSKTARRRFTVRSR